MYLMNAFRPGIKNKQDDHLFSIQVHLPKLPFSFVLWL